MILFDFAHYLLLRTLSFPLQFLPTSWIHFLGKQIGNLSFYLIPSYRKRALSNLALATTLELNKKKTRTIAKESLQNLAITCLEYPKLKRLKNLDSLVHCTNDTEALQLSLCRQGIVFFCAHQANWELFFLEGTKKMPGTAIGKSVKNPYLYRYITEIREKFGGKMVSPREGLKKGLQTLKRGDFFGVVADQSLPESRYSFPFFGRRAWTTPLPAILAYRAKAPMIVATIFRKNSHYTIEYSPPIWPDVDAPLEREIERLTSYALSHLEEKIRLYPGQWLWQHNRWKQERANIVYYKFRHESILIILPKEKEELSSLIPHLPTFRKLYPRAFLTLLVPFWWRGPSPIEGANLLTYANDKELFLHNYQFKMVFNLSKEKKLKQHFLRQSAFTVLSLATLEKLAHRKNGSKMDTFSTILQKALSRIPPPS